MENENLIPEEEVSILTMTDENGADVIELNFSCPNMAEGGLGSDIGQVPELVERFEKRVIAINEGLVVHDGMDGYFSYEG